MLTKENAETLRSIALSIPDGAETELLTAIARSIESEVSARAEQARKDAHLQGIGERAAASIAEMVAALNCDYDRLAELRATLARGEVMDSDEREELRQLDDAAGDCTDREDAEQRIYEDPLSVQVRCGWHDPYTSERSNDLPAPEEFEILLSTGGPATRIIGELDQYCQPTRAWLQAQDWFTQWTDYRGDAVSSDDLLTYCQQFYFGE